MCRHHVSVDVTKTRAFLSSVHGGSHPAAAHSLGPRAEAGRGIPSPRVRARNSSSNSTPFSLPGQNFLDNFPSSDVLSFVARIFLLFQMMTVYPLLGYLARVQLLGHVFGDVYPR